MMTTDEAIKRFEKQLTDARVILDSGFGTHEGECDTIYRHRKEMAEIALAALRRTAENDKAMEAERVVDWDIVARLMTAFPDSFINQRQEFIVHREANEYFILKDCATEQDVQCKVLEWLSRAAYKSQPFGPRKNKAFHAFMLDGINQFLGASFTADDMELIYTYLGNAVDHDKTVRFIESGYDMAALSERGGEE